MSPSATKTETVVPAVTKMATSTAVNGTSPTITTAAPPRSPDLKNAVHVPEKVGDFEYGPWKLRDVLIPASAGRGLVKKYHQRRTLYQYTLVSLAGLWTFYNQSNPAYRAAALGLLYPGAGLVAVGTIPSLLAFVVSQMVFPATMFLWFAMGGIFFPLAVWGGTVLLAGLLASRGDGLWNGAGVLVPIFCVFGLSWIMYKTSRLNAAGYTRAQERNKYLMAAVEEQRQNAVPAPPVDARELDLETLRHIQFTIERGLSPKKDWSMFDIIDQFQPAALRYQLYSVVDVLSLYQAHYVPNFHGYVSKASQNAIEKSLCKRVMSYWKWESIFGKFKFNDWDPIKKDNIMVTGYLLSAIGLYEQATGDRQYHQNDTLEFVVDDGKHYKTSFVGLADALNRNMTENPYCLYPCEPNWTYSLCNLIGMAGLTISDRLLERDFAERIRARFEKCLEEEFSECDGRILPLRSEFTGLTIPNICGVLTDCINAMLLTAYLPHIAHRNWAMIRTEFLTRDAEGELAINDLRGADKMDPCNYKAGEGAIRAYVAAAAAEFGDEDTKRAALRQLDGVYFPVEATESGSLRNRGLSAISQGVALMARLVRHRDMANATLGRVGARGGPLLQDVPFPQVLVARAFSRDEKGLDLVLHNGREPGEFTLGLEKLVPGVRYLASNGESMVADVSGKGSVRVRVDGRTELVIKPQA